MEVRNDGDVPGATGQGTCEEMALVVDEMGNDHLKDVLGKFGDGGQARRGNLYRSTAGTLLDSGQASVQNSHSEQLNHYG